VQLDRSSRARSSKNDLEKFCTFLLTQQQPLKDNHPMYFLQSEWAKLYLFQVMLNYQL